VSSAASSVRRASRPLSGSRPNPEPIDGWQRGSRDNGRALLEESPRRDRAAGRRDSRGEYGRDVDSGAFNRVAIMRSLGSDYGPSMTILLAECVLVRAATGIDSGGEVHGLSRLQFGQSLSDQVFVSAPTLRVRRGDSQRSGGVGE